MIQNRKSTTDINGTGWDALEKAVIIQAAEDYKKYQFVLDTMHMRSYKTYENRWRAIQRATFELDSVKIFFESPWFEALSGGLDGERAMRALKQTYLEEYYPARMEEWEELNGRAKGFIREAKTF